MLQCEELNYISHSYYALIAVVTVVLQRENDVSWHCDVEIECIIDLQRLTVTVS